MFTTLTPQRYYRVAQNNCPFFSEIHFTSTNDCQIVLLFGHRICIRKLEKGRKGIAPAHKLKYRLFQMKKYSTLSLLSGCFNRQLCENDNHIDYSQNFAINWRLFGWWPACYSYDCHKFDSAVENSNIGLPCAIRFNIYSDHVKIWKLSNVNHAVWQCTIWTCLVLAETLLTKWMKSHWLESLYLHDLNYNAHADWVDNEDVCHYVLRLHLRSKINRKLYQK